MKIQRWLIFRPNKKDNIDFSDIGNSQYSFGYININDQQLFYRHFHKPNRKVILYFHGNIGPTNSGKLAKIFDEMGYNIFIISYRGYNYSTKIDITQHSLYDDAEVAIQYLSRLYNIDDIIVYGCSLGTGLASYISSKYNVSKLILEAPYYSFVSLIRDYIPIPKSLIFYRFNVYKNLLSTRCPVYILHGTDDNVINISHSYDLERLCDKLYILQGAKHNTIKNHPRYIHAMRSILS